MRDQLLGAAAVTLHRLLGWRPGSRSRFRHDHTNRLPHEVVVVDETSMVSTAMMARLVDAVSPAARLILVGDADQLASVEAGAVLGDIVGPARRDRRTSLPGHRAIVVLDRVHRFGHRRDRCAASTASATAIADAGRCACARRRRRRDERSSPGPTA